IHRSAHLKKWQSSARNADGTARAARGDCTRLCVLRLAAMLKLHHRRNLADSRRILTCANHGWLRQSAPSSFTSMTAKQVSSVGAPARDSPTSHTAVKKFTTRETLRE